MVEIGIVIGLTVLVLVIRYVVGSLVNKGADTIENAYKNRKNEKNNMRRQNGEDTSQSLADRYKK